MAEHQVGILVVDDEEGIRDLLKENLEEEGYLCYTARDGDEALDLLESQVVDLVLIDVIMPGTNGLSLFQRMTQLYPDVAAIFITAMDDVDVAVDQLKNGAYDYLQKPVTRARLSQAVEEALGKRKVSLEENQARKTLENALIQRAQELEEKVREFGALSRISRDGQSERRTASITDQVGRTDISRPGGRSRVPVHESVKKRVSDFLHGHVQSKLLVLQYRLGQCQELVAADPHRAGILLEEIKAGLRSVQEEDIRRASHDLYPSIVKLGLVPALRSLTERFRHTVSIELSVDSKIPQTAQWDWSTLPEEFRVGVYRIVEEALDNVVKHAGARMARVTVQYNEDETISLDISDDGRGFEVGDASASFGLMTIGEYAAALGGKLHVGSVPSQGTWVEVTLPAPRS